MSTKAETFFDYHKFLSVLLFLNEGSEDDHPLLLVHELCLCF